MAAGRHGRAVFWSVAALIVAGGALSYALLLGREPGAGPAPAAAPVAAAAPGLAVTAATGTVEIVRGGVRAPARPGDALGADDELVTTGDGRVELSAGDSYAVALEGAARVGVEEITATLARFRLESGLVAARVRPDAARAVEIASGAGAVARTTGGALSVARSGQVVAVAVTEGAAELRAGGGAVTLAAGQRSLVRDGGAPGPVTPIPAALLLKVSWPRETATNRPRIVVTGRTEPGALLVLGGEPVQVAPDGTFTHVVYLREGNQRLAASARAVGGRVARDESAPVVLDTRAPDARFDTRGLWGKVRP